MSKDRAPKKNKCTDKLKINNNSHPTPVKFFREVN